ncbi:MAG: dehydrogenase [Gemmatimonadetes bacterium]|nr:dehydrogenase [Gemmatimonadota bacterium]
MNAFEYFLPTSAKEAAQLLHKYPKAMVLAGGTDLLVRMKVRVYQPSVVIDIKRLPKADEIRYSTKGGLTLGTATSVRQVELSQTVIDRYPALSQGAGFIGSPQIRNRATVIGNIVNAAPSADTAPGVIVHGGKVNIAGPKGRRSMLCEDFITGPGKRDLKRGEFVSSIQIPTPPARTGSAYVRHTPRFAMDIAVVGVGAAVTLGSKNVCKDVKIVLGAVAPVPMRAVEAEAILRGNELTPQLLAEAGEAAAAETKPISDIRASEEFRRELVRVLTQRMVSAASDSAQTPIAKRRAA